MYEKKKEIICPECNSNKLKKFLIIPFMKDGENHLRQNFQCNSCGLKFFIEANINELNKGEL